jgi:hypothetical protein
MRTAYRLATLFSVGLACWPAPLAAQSSSAAMARQLTTLLDRARLDSIAVRLPGTDDSFVAASYVPGQQLIVVSARYAVPVLLREKILRKHYREAYLDLYSASDRATRRVVEDLRADGLQPLQRKGDPFDIYTRRGGESIPFDGEWKRRKTTESTYMETFRHADTVYGDMLKVLISELQAPAAVTAGVEPGRTPEDVVK